MTARQAAFASSLSLILVVAIGLAAGLLGTPDRWSAFASPSLTSAAITVPGVFVAGLADGINPSLLHISVERPKGAAHD